MVIIDETKLTYGTLREIGFDYGIMGNVYDEEYVDEVVDRLKEDTERFKEAVVKKVIIDFSK